MTIRPATIRTARLTLRPWENDDAGAFHEIWGDPAVIWWGAARDHDESAAILAQIVEHHGGRGPGLGWWAIVSNDEGAIVGNALLKPDAATGELEIGWHIAKRAQGRGYATEAARALIAHARGALGITAPIVATIVPDNAASRRVAEKLGMHREGTVTKAGLLHDVWVVALE